MTASPPDKAGLHILLKLACLVVILAGIHAAADMIVQLLLALFFAIVLNPLVTWFLRRGISRPVAITIVVMVMLVVLTALFGVLAASLSEFSTMLPQYNKELTRKLVESSAHVAIRESAYLTGTDAAPDGFREGDDLRHHVDDRAFRGNGQHSAAGDDGGVYAVRSAPRAV